MTSAEASERFECFGGTAAVIVSGGPDPSEAVELARDRMLDVHLKLSRFLPDSELTRLNENPAEMVPASPLMRRFVAAARNAGLRSGGLVDPTLLGPLELAGYRRSMADRSGSLPLLQALAAAPRRRPATASTTGDWRLLEVNETAGTVSRPRGVRLDSGGVAKGLVADLLGAGLQDRPQYVVDCCGDLRIGGSAGAERRVRVEGPFGEGTIAELNVASGAVATSGIGRRAWLSPDGTPAHHLLDPGSGRPAFTGLVQVTALAPTVCLAEVLAKTALLSGPERAESELPYGGVIVRDDGSVQLLPAYARLPGAILEAIA